MDKQEQAEFDKLVEERDALALALEQARKIVAPEAGFSVTWQVQPGGKVANLQCTARDPLLDNAEHVIQRVAGLWKRYEWSLIEPPQAAPPPVPSKAAEAVKDGTPEAQAAVKAVVEGVGDPPAGKEWQTCDVCFVKILPQPGELVSIEFYGNAHKQPHDDFPEVKVNKWKYEQAAGLMKHVTSASVKEANEFALSCRVYYTIGKEYTKKDGSKGNYRDIGHVRLIE